MKTFKELCDGKVWRAVEAMITGLEVHSKRKDFIIDMTTYGKATGPDICFGCAATCAVQQLCGIDLKPGTFINRKSHWRAATLKVDMSDLEYFEQAINDLRTGYETPLFDYMGVRVPIVLARKIRLPILTSYNWQHRLQPYRLLLRYLKRYDI